MGVTSGTPPSSVFPHGPDALLPVLELDVIPIIILALLISMSYFLYVRLPFPDARFLPNLRIKDRTNLIIHLKLGF